METFRRNNPTIVNAWSMFDWANSSFALVITVAIFPAYFIAVTHEEIHLAGIKISNSALYAYAISFSYLVIAAFSPLLSGIADYGGKRKFFLKSFTVMGSMACISLFFFTGMENLWLGTTAFIIAMIGFAGGLVFYNSYFFPEAPLASMHRTEITFDFGLLVCKTICELIKHNCTLLK